MLNLEECKNCPSTVCDTVAQERFDKFDHCCYSFMSELTNWLVNSMPFPV
jgi:hypothetical protein